MARDPWPGITREQWTALLAAHVGWVLDAMDIMLYAFALTAIKEEFGLTSSIAGALVSATLLASALGGAACGVLADRYGRARMLVVSVLTYSVFTALTATARGPLELLLWRSLVGLGLGAEWTAGSVLVAETWPAAHRGKASAIMQSGWAIGTLLAAGLAAIVLPTWGWRPLFVIGFLPALFALWVRRRVREPEIWSRARRDRGSSADWPALKMLLHAPLAGRALIATAMSTCLLFAYWGLFTWVPTYLAAPLERGGAGLGLVRSVGWIAAIQVGAFLGYLSFGPVADRYGRRPALLAFVGGAALVAPAFGSVAASPALLFGLAPLVGFFGHGYFSVFGALLAELFPSTIRATAQGLCYNAGRALSAFAPALIGTVADRSGLGSGIALTSLFFAAGGLLVLLLPETSGRALE